MNQNQQAQINVMHITFDMGIGGTEQVIKNLIEGSHNANVRHHVCCIEAPLGPWGQQLKEHGIPVWVFNRPAKLSFKLIKQIRQLIKQHNIHIVHGHQYTPFVYGFFASRFTQAKTLFTEHGRLYPDVVSSKRKLVNKLIFPFVNGVTAISQATKTALVENEGIRAQQIRVIYNGIKAVAPSTEEELAALRQQHNIAPSDFIFGTVARLDPIKNQGFMINGFAELAKHRDDIKLILVGDGPDRSQLEQQVAELKLSEKVIFTGFIANPQHYINLFDVFLLTSLTEGTSMTLLEAMSAGKPSIVSNVGGNPEIISQSDLGSVYQPGKLNEFSECMAHWQTAIKTQPKQALARQKHFNQHYSDSTMNQSFSKLYGAQQVLKGATA